MYILSAQVGRWEHVYTANGIGTNGKPLAAISTFSHAISKTMATNGEKTTNAMIGNKLINYW